MIKYFRKFSPAIFLSALIFTLSSISGLKASDAYEVDLLSRKSAHIIMFFLLTISYMWALIPSANLRKLTFAELKASYVSAEVELPVKRSPDISEAKGLKPRMKRSGVRGEVTKLSNSYYLIAFILSTLYAISDEIHQTFVYNRTGKVTDVLIDMIAISLAILLFKRKMILK